MYKISSNAQLKRVPKHTTIATAVVERFTEPPDADEGLMVASAYRGNVPSVLLKRDKHAGAPLSSSHPALLLGPRHISNSISFERAHNSVGMRPVK